jgi:hypothetical protein
VTYESNKKYNLELMVVVGEDYQGKPATLDFCHPYAQAIKVDPAKVYIDPNHQTLLTFIDPMVPLSQFAIPWDSVLDGDDLEYVYSSLIDDYPGMGVKTALYEAIND